MAERKDEGVSIKKQTSSTEKVRRPQKERVEMVDMSETKVRIPREIEGWMEKIEKKPSKLSDDVSDAGMSVSDVSDDNYRLPVTRLKFVDGFKKGVEDVTRWLSVFVLRVVKKKQGKVKFKDNNE